MSSDEAIPTPPPPASSRLLPVVMVLCLGNLGATAFVAIKVVKIKVTAPEGAGHGADGGATAKSPPIVPFEPPFVVNLNEPNSTRYLKVGFELELANAGVVEELDRSKKAVRDEVLRYLSGLNVADTMGETGKSKIQTEILVRINRSLGGTKVRRLFYTEFVVQ